MSIRDYLQPNSPEAYRRNRRILMVIVALLVIAGVIVALVIYSIHLDDGKVRVGGIGNCATGITSDREKQISKQLFSAIDNSVDAKNRKGKYEATIREGSCEATDGFMLGQNYTEVTMIIDVKSVHRSRRLTFLYVKEGVETIDSFDIGPTNINCLEPEEEIFDDNECVETNEDMADAERLKLSTDVIHNAPVASDEIEGCYMQKIISATAKSGFNIIVRYEPSDAYISADRFASEQAQCLAQIKQSIVDAGGNLEDYNIYLKK